MSRKPSDTFTRFTPTAPHASHPAPPPPPSSSTTSPTPKPTPQNPNETPAERVSRLRTAHRLQRSALSLSPIDRLIYRGRIWADITHRIAAYTLIGFAGIASCVAAFSLVSLVTHNRRQKRAWIEREMGRLDDARRAFLSGTATPEQLHLLEQERAGEEIVGKHVAEKKRRKEEGILGRARAFLGGQAAGGDKGREEDGVSSSSSKTVRQGGERILEEVWTTTTTETQPPQAQAQFSRSESERAVASGVQGVGLDSKGRPVPMDRAVKEYEQRQAAAGAQGSSNNRTAAAQKEVNAPTTTIRGGPLDVMAGNIAGTVTSNGSGDWLSWLRSSKS